MKKYLLSFIAFTLYIGGTTAFGQETQDLSTTIAIEKDTIVSGNPHENLSEILNITDIGKDSIILDNDLLDLIDSQDILTDSLHLINPIVNADSIIVDTDKNEAAQFGFIEAKETRRYLANFRERRSRYEFTFKSSILKPNDILTFHYTDIVDRKEKTKSVIYKVGINELLINNVDPVRNRYQGTVWISVKRKDQIIFDRVKVVDNWFSIEQ